MSGLMNEIKGVWKGNIYIYEWMIVWLTEWLT